MLLHAFAIFCSTFQHASWCANVVLPGETLRGAGGQIAEGAVLTMFDPAVTSLSVERTPSIRHTLQGLYWRCKLLQEFQSNEKTVQHLDKWKYQLNTWQAETWLRDSGDLFCAFLHKLFEPQVSADLDAEIANSKAQEGAVSSRIYQIYPRCSRYLKLILYVLCITWPRVKHSQTLPKHCMAVIHTRNQMGSLCGFDSYHWDLNGSLPAASLFELLLQPLCIHALRSEKLCQQHMMVFPAWFSLPRSMHLMLQFCVRWCCLWKAHLMHQNPSQVWMHPSCTKQAQRWICKVVSLRVLESTWEYGSRSPWSKCHCVHRGPSAKAVKMLTEAQVVPMTSVDVGALVLARCEP